MSYVVKFDRNAQVFAREVRTGLRGGSSSSAIARAATRSARITQHEIRKQIRQKLSKRPTGKLERSWKISVVNPQPGVWQGSVSSDLPYARIQNTGGTIRAKRSANLTIPMTEEARRKSARAFGGRLFPLVVNGTTFLVERRGGSLAFHYVLKPRVKLRGTGYLDEAAKRSARRVATEFSKGLAMMLSNAANKANRSSK